MAFGLLKKHGIFILLSTLDAVLNVILEDP